MSTEDGLWGATVAEDPAKYGLELVALVSDDSLSFEFDYFLILRDPRTGEYLWATDFGCSCPIPFEDTTVDEMARGNSRDCLNDLEVWCKGDSWRGGRAAAWCRAMESAWLKEMTKP